MLETMYVSLVFTYLIHWLAHPNSRLGTPLDLIKNAILSKG